MTEEEFHRARRMWAVTDHGVMVAEPGDPRTHYEWLASWFGGGPTGDWFEGITRGYVLDGRLVAYKGQDFSRWVNWDDVLMALNELEKVCGRIEMVEFGARHSVMEMPWPTVAAAGVQQFRAFMAKRARKNT